MNSSAIVDLEAIGTDEESDYEVDFSSDPSKVSPAESSDFVSNDQTWSAKGESKQDDLKGEITKGVASYVWQEGQQRARQAFGLYANIDVLRPYYDVEPRNVRDRLLESLIPKIQNSPTKIPRELYGPTMMVLTLIALLLFQMKSYKVSVQEGTLMGSAFVTCFGYWFGVSGFLWVAAFVCNTRIAIIQLLNLLGYALFGHCVVICLTVVIHPNHSHLFFYVMWLVFGGLSSLRLASLLMSRTSGKTQKMVISAIVICFHLFFLFYLHFAYHHVVEDLSHAFESAAQPLSIERSHDQELNVIHKPQEEINVVSEAALNMATKASKRAFRKGFASFEAGKQHEIAKSFQQ